MRVRPFRVKFFGGDDAIRKDVRDGVPPALDNAVWTANHGQLAADHAGSEDGRERLAGPCARPVADPLLLSDADGEVALHQVRRARLAVDGESDSRAEWQVLWPGDIRPETCVRICSAYPSPETPWPAPPRPLRPVGVLPNLGDCGGEQEFDRFLVRRTDDVEAERTQNVFGLDDRELLFASSPLPQRVHPHGLEESLPWLVFFAAFRDSRV